MTICLTNQMGIHVLKSCKPIAATILNRFLTLYESTCKQNNENCIIKFIAAASYKTFPYIENDKK